MNWNELPEIDYIYECLRKRAELKARLEMLEAELKIEQSKIAKVKPRDTAARIIGVDESSGKKLLDLQMEIAALRGDIGRTEADVEFNNYRKEIFKSLSFNQR